MLSDEYTREEIKGSIADVKEACYYHEVTYYNTKVNRTLADLNNLEGISTPFLCSL